MTLEGTFELDSRHQPIERPRLTKLLDEATSRIILLLAPAGFGKTTLARQWLEGGERPHGWYAANSASHDVAALAAGISHACAAIVPGAGDRMIERLRVTKDPSAEVDVLAEMVAEDLVSWPDHTWLVIDDYHLFSESPPSQEFVRLLHELTSLRFLIASRDRPSWISARDVLYGRVFELGRNDLAMSREEAVSLFEDANAPAVPGLLALADGWPAVLRLASLQPEPKVPSEPLPEELYEFFAEELYRELDPEIQSGLRELAIAEVTDRQLVWDLLGSERAERLVAAAVPTGFLSTQRGEQVDLHPLLRAFLVEKALERPTQELHLTVQRAVMFLLDRESWDPAFAVIRKFSRLDLIRALILRGLDAALALGRATSVQEWVRLGEESGLSDGAVALAAAELAFRDGRFAEAEALGVLAARTDEECSYRGYLAAGRAAHIASHEDRAILHYESAQGNATNEADARKAAWGLLACESDLELPHAEQAFELLASGGDDSPGEIIIRETRRLNLNSHWGRIELDAGREAARLVHLEHDPVQRCAFLSAFAYLLGLAAEYDEALGAAERFIADARKYRLQFALPYAMVAYGIAKAGLRDIDASLVALDEGRHIAEITNDIFGLANIAAAKSRTLLPKGDYAGALAAIDRSFDGITRAMKSELMATRSLALACMGDHIAALATATEAEQLSRTVETQVLAPAARAVVALKKGGVGWLDAAETALLAAHSTGAFDGFVVAYRACPDLIVALLASEHTQPRALVVVRRAGDQHLIEGIQGGPIAGSSHRLSKREIEVIRLVARGMSNHEIAQHLYLSDVTVKVHVRNIFAKLGVRSRTAAAMRAVAEGYAAPTARRPDARDDVA